MITTDRAVIVEGKYDKITLENIIDAPIIKTDGFGIFKDKGKRELIKKLGEKRGLIVLTDSDNAGNQIRNYIKNFCSKADIINVYIPQKEGKEKRKSSPGKQGLIGVEGMSEEILLNAFSRAGIVARHNNERKDKITKIDLYLLGLSGKKESSFLRENLAQFLDIPCGMSSSAFLDALNSLYTKEEFERQVNLWRQEADKK